jgi:hypothetical protein
MVVGGSTSITMMEGGITMVLAANIAVVSAFVAATVMMTTIGLQL